MLASVVGGLLTRTLVSSQVECVTENATVYSFYMLMWFLCDFNAAKLFLEVNIFVVSVPAHVSQLHEQAKKSFLLYRFESAPVTYIVSEEQSLHNIKYHQ